MGSDGEEKKLIKGVISSLIGALLGSSPASALAGTPTPSNSDRWVLYDRVASDSQPLVILVRTGNVEAEALLRKGLVTVIGCQASPADVNDQGMPQGTARLYTLEDQLDEGPTLLAARAIRIASVTGQSQRRMFFVHRDPIDFSSILATIKVEGFECRASDVTDREALIRLITPTALQSQLNGDREVIANLQESGDTGLLPRKTDFWFYGEKSALLGLATHLKPLGFSINHWLENPVGFVLSREMPVDMASFQTTTPTLLDSADQFNVEYDGWETLVVAPTQKRSGSN